MKSMLISGGNGFLGSHLAEDAISRGIKVTVVDDFSTSNMLNLPQEVELIRKKIEDFNSEDRFDYLVHLAARPSPEDYIDHPVSTILSNSEGTKVMLDLAVKSRGIFLYTSSSEVYGDSSIIPTPESYYGNVNPNGIRSCYDESKRFSEALAMAYHREYGVDVRIQRPFNVYGPRIRPDGQYGRVIPRFIEQALKGQDLTVHGDGSQTRSFLYISDWLEATRKMLYNEGLAGSILNIGSVKEYTVKELAEIIIKQTGSSSKLIHEPAREDDPRRRSADTKKASDLLSWKPTVSLEEGLEKTTEWIKERLK